LKPSELEGVLAHEVMHVALAHHCRRGDREREIWNEAADYAINPILLGNGFTLPAGALVNPSYTDLSAEEIYSRLMQQKNDGSAPSQSSQPANSGGTSPEQSPAASSGSPGLDSKGDPSGRVSSQQGSSEKDRDVPSLPEHPGGFGEVLDAVDDNGNAASPAEKSRQEHEWAIAAEQAVRAAKMCGHEPADVARLLGESRESKQDWRAILRDFITAATPSDYRWTPPNRRHISSGLYLPSLHGHGLGPIVIAVDTSGSIGSRELEQFAGEISAIADEAKPEAIHVVYCDAAVQSSQEFGPSEPVCLEPKGGGGTDFRPAFEWVQRTGLEPVCLIYLTDLCCSSYPDPPSFPVLWVTDSRRAAPFGETVPISLEE
jgi:predicted metal-dependent peptidase